ncbi:MAG: PilZ domain-containing protein [Acidobacteriia bacterium]|nr:PilZ domain-containing protein [Terriglobia bacterium]
MALTSLLVCADTKAVQVLSRILTDLSIRVEQCNELSAALAQATTRPFDALLVDCQDEPTATRWIASVRKAPANQGALIIAIVDSQNQVREIFAKGANFVLYKPISAERAGTSLRAARSLMRRERRRCQRIPLHTPASMAYAATEDAPATLLDLSEEGIAIQCEHRLPPRCKVYFQFNLPGHVSTVRLSGEVMWQDSSGRVGIRFADVPQASRRVLSDWLKTNTSRQSQAAEKVPSVTTHGSSSGLGLLSVSNGDRREKSRLACRLSADVYRLGNGVPNRCSLSDIGTGGCYVETTEPFPASTNVEIVVRTKDMKLRVQGTVQAMHPGVGMGVAFSIQTAEERDQVQQLIACQASASILV